MTEKGRGPRIPPREYLGRKGRERWYPEAETAPVPAKAPRTIGFPKLSDEELYQRALNSHAMDLACDKGEECSVYEEHQKHLHAFLEDYARRTR